MVGHVQGGDRDELHLYHLPLHHGGAGDARVALTALDALFLTWQLRREERG